MPTYCFENSKGEIVHRPYLMSNCPRSIRVEGSVYRKNVVCVHRNHRSGTGKAKWPIWSESAAVPPEDIPEAVAFNKARGCDIDFDSDGRPGWRSEGHKAQFLKAQDDGMFAKGRV